MSVLSPQELKAIADEEGRALLVVVNAGAGDFPIDKVFPFLAVVAVANTALITMLMASRLIYIMANQKVLPPALGKVSPTTRSPWVAILFATALALGLIFYVTRDAESEVVSNLSSVTSLLLLCVFALVNVACLVLRRKDPERESFFRSPGPTPAIAAVLALFLVGPWVDREAVVYQIAGALMVVGVVLWAITWVANRAVSGSKTGFRDVDKLGE